jgi:PAS domain S-box-containing protein
MAIVAPALSSLGLDDALNRDLVIGGLAFLAVLALALRTRSLSRRHRAMVAELQQSTVHVTAIVDCSLDAIVGMDEEGRITQWNPMAEELFGWSETEAVGRLVSQTIVPERYRLEHEKGLSHFRRTGEGALLGRVTELVAARRDGSELPVDLSVNLAARDGDGGAVFVAVVRDVTSRQRAERLQGVRFIVAGVLSDATSLPETLDRVLAAIASRMGFAAAALWTPSIGGLRSQHLWAADRPAVKELLRATLQTTLAAGSGLPGRVWSTGRALTLSELGSTHEDFARMATASQAGLRDSLAVPVIAGDRVLAVMEFFASERRETDEELVRTLTDLGGQLGQFVARRQAEMREDSPQRLQETLEGAADAVVTVADNGGVMSLNSRARSAFGYGTLEVLGEDLRTLITEPHREGLIEYVSNCLRHQAGGPPPPRWCELVGRRKDGTIFDFGLHLTPINVGGRNIFMGLIAPGPAARRYVSDTSGSNPALRVYNGQVDRERSPRLA